jgi:putative transposase
MPTHKRHFAPRQLQFLTSSTYRRVKVFESDRFRWSFVEVLGQLRAEMGFLLIGWVLMPDHFHLLIKPEPAASTSRFMQELKKRTAQRLLAALAENQRLPWCGKMLARLRLPPTVHADSQFRVWQRRFYPFGICREEKRLEKLNYMHGNPVKCGLVTSPAFDPLLKSQVLWQMARPPNGMFASEVPRKIASRIFSAFGNVESALDLFQSISRQHLNRQLPKKQNCQDAIATEQVLVLPTAFCLLPTVWRIDP